jgi:hypothetical protein
MLLRPADCSTRHSGCHPRQSSQPARPARPPHHNHLVRHTASAATAPLDRVTDSPATNGMRCLLPSPPRRTVEKARRFLSTMRSHQEPSGDGVGSVSILLPTSISPHDREWAQGRERGNMSRGNENRRPRVAMCRHLVELTRWTDIASIGTLKLDKRGRMTVVPWFFSDVARRCHE